MTFKVFVQDEIDSSYDSEKHKKRISQRSLILADQSDGRKLMHLIQYPMGAEEVQKYSGKVNGRTGEFTVLQINDQLFGGMVKVIRGEINFNGVK